jgi:hypothetical protein
MSLGFGLALCAMVFPAAGFAQRAPEHARFNAPLTRSDLIKFGS